MLVLLWLVLVLFVVSFPLLLLVLWRRAIRERYSGGRTVACPENQQPAVVGIDVRDAASTIMSGHSDLRLSECSRWPEHSQCNQDCLSQAMQAEPYKAGVAKEKRKQIYHLPALLGGFAAWYVGAIWHSQYLFRARWMQAVGLTPAQVRQLVWSVTPHLLTLAICILFAYGVAWLLAMFHHKGMLYGVLMSVLLGGAVIASSWFGIARLPHDLFMIEAGYAVLATLTVGAIVGGLYDKLVLS